MADPSQNSNNYFEKGFSTANWGVDMHSKIKYANSQEYIDTSNKNVNLLKDSIGNIYEQGLMNSNPLANNTDHSNYDRFMLDRTNVDHSHDHYFHHSYNNNNNNNLELSQPQYNENQMNRQRKVSKQYGSDVYSKTNYINSNHKSLYQNNIYNNNLYHNNMSPNNVSYNKTEIQKNSPDPNYRNNLNSYNNDASYASKNHRNEMQEFGHNMDIQMRMESQSEGAVSRNIYGHNSGLERKNIQNTSFIPNADSYAAHSAQNYNYSQNDWMTRSVNNLDMNFENLSLSNKNKRASFSQVMSYQKMNHPEYGGQVNTQNQKISTIQEYSHENYTTKTNSLGGNELNSGSYISKLEQAIMNRNISNQNSFSENYSSFDYRTNITFDPSKNGTIYGAYQTENLINIADFRNTSFPALKNKNGSFGNYYPDFNCYLPNSDHLSSSLSSIPISNDQLEKIKLPFGLIFTPFVKDLNVPVVNAEEVLRCTKCLMYLNPFVEWVDAVSYNCNACAKKRVIAPEKFVQYVDKDSRKDVNNMPIKDIFKKQLMSCTYDVLAPPSYCSTPPKPSCYVFLLELTKDIVSTGYIDILLECIISKIDNCVPNSSSTVAFIAYDRFIHYYTLKLFPDGSHKFVHYVVTDIDDMMLPYEEEIFIPAETLKENISLIKRLSGSIRSHAQFSTDCCLGSVLEMCTKLLKNGGRLFLFNSKPANIGKGIVSKNDLGLDEEDDLREIPKPHNLFYKSLGLEAGKLGITIDLHYVSFDNYTNLVNILPIVYSNGGKHYFYPYYTKSLEEQFGHKFEKTLINLFSEEVALDTSVTLRMSRGMEITSHYGNCVLVGTNKCRIPYLTTNQTFTYKIQYSDTPYISRSHVFFQFATMFTTNQGERRLRVTTLPVKIEQTKFSSIYNNVKQFSMVTLMARLIQYHATKSSLVDIKDASLNACKDIITSFYAKKSMKFDGKNLYTTVEMQHLFLCIHALVNNTYLSFQTNSETIDARISYLEFMKSCPVKELILLLCPRLYPLNELEKHSIDAIKNEDVIPPLLPSARFMQQANAYLLVDAFSSYVFIPEDLPQHLLKCWFNVEYINSLPYRIIGIPNYNNELSYKLSMFVSKVTYDNIPKYNTCILRNDSLNSNQFFRFLVIDKRPNKLPSLNEYYNTIKEAILDD